MKVLKNNWLILGLFAMVLGFTSCSEDEEVIPLFPETTDELVVITGETTQVSFTANMAWQLSSDAVWCLLGEDSLQDISGLAGDQFIKVFITDAAWGFEEDVANITLKMGGQEQVIATVTRDPKEYELSVVNEEGETVDKVVIDEKGLATYTVVSNFEFAVSKTPEWLTAMPYEIEGEAFNKTITFTINRGYEKNAADSVIVFANTDSVQIEIPVSYSGMNPTDISFTPSSTWGLNVSADGKTYFSALNTDVVNEAPYKVTIAAANDAYSLVYYNFDSQYGMTQIQTSYETPWFNAADDKKGNVTVSFAENTGAERKGYLFAFPNAIYDEIKNNLDGFICDQSTDVWQLHSQAEKYLVAEFIQQAGEVSSKPFDVMYQGYQPLDVTKVTETSFLEFIASECGGMIDEVYQISCAPGSWLQIFPNLPEDAWTCEIAPMINGFGFNITEAQMAEMGIEPGIWDGGRHYISLSTPEVDGPIYIAFRDNMWKFHKVLVILPN